MHSDETLPNNEDLAIEYTFDYKKAKSNRFTTQNNDCKMTVVVLKDAK